MPQTDCALADLAHGCIGFDQNIIQGFTLRQADAELAGLIPQGFITQALELALEHVDLINNGDELIDFLLVGVSAEQADEFLEHTSPGYHTHSENL